MKKMIQVTNLEKSYGDHKAVKGVSFDVQKGSICAVLGPNGAGKSTLINMLSTIMEPDKGKILIDGREVSQDKRRVKMNTGVVFQDSVLDQKLTIAENLYIRGRFYGLKGRILEERIIEVTSMAEIYTMLERKYGQLSGGQRRRCDIARALLHNPGVLILDEPTTGLDPEIRALIWKTLKSARNQTGVTILMTTHYMEEAAHADYIIIMNNGKITALGAPDQLKSIYSRDRITMFTDKTEQLGQILERKCVPFCKVNGGVEIRLNRMEDSLEILEACRGTYSSFEVVRGSLEDAYLNAIRREV